MSKKAILTLSLLCLSVACLPGREEEPVRFVFHDFITNESVKVFQASIAAANQAMPSFIELEVSSSGGVVFAALDLARIVKDNPIPVRTRAIKGCGASALFMVFAGSQGHRASQPGLEFRLGPLGITNRKVDAALNDSLLEIYGPQSAERLQNLIRSGQAITAEEAMKFGLIDSIKD